MEPPMNGWIQSMLSGAFALGTKGSRVNLLVTTEVQANSAIAEKHSNGCWRLHYIKTPHLHPLQRYYIQISTPSVKQEVVLGQIAIFIKGCSMYGKA
jgi:hypothetical protein